MGEIIVFILVGLVIGIIARALLPGRDPIGILGTILVGIVGAVIGGYLVQAAFEDSGTLMNALGAVLVAMGLLYLYRKMTLSRSHSVR